MLKVLPKLILVNVNEALWFSDLCFKNQFYTYKICRESKTNIKDIVCRAYFLSSLCTGVVVQGVECSSPQVHCEGVCVNCIICIVCGNKRDFQ